MDMKDIAVNVFKGNAEKVRDLVAAALGSGTSAEHILNNGLIIGMDSVGDKFKTKDMYLPEVILAGEAMNAGMQLIKPFLPKKDGGIGTTIIMGTVKDDIHDIGKNIVAMMLEGAGFEVIDLGVDLPSKKIVKNIVEKSARVVGLSSLLTTTRPRMKETVEEISQQGLREKVKVVVGGAPINQTFADEIGADGYAIDGATAVGLVRNLVKE